GVMCATENPHDLSRSKQIPETEACQAKCLRKRACDYQVGGSSHQVCRGNTTELEVRFVDNEDGRDRRAAVQQFFDLVRANRVTDWVVWIHNIRQARRLLTESFREVCHRESRCT